MLSSGIFDRSSPCHRVWTQCEMLDASVSPSTGQAQKYCPFFSQKASIHFSCLFFNAAHFTAIATLADTYDLFPYMFLSLSLSISLSLSSLPPSLLPQCLFLSSYVSLSLSLSLSLSSDAHFIVLGKHM